jgi:hypothetical protein
MSQSQEEKEQAKEQARKELLEDLHRRQTYLNERKLFWEELISKHKSNLPQNEPQEIFWKVTLDNYTAELKAIELGIKNFPAKRARELAILDDPNLLRREWYDNWAKDDAARAAAHREKEAAKEWQDAQELRDAKNAKNAEDQEWLHEIADSDSSEHDSDEEELRAKFFGGDDDTNAPTAYDGDHDTHAPWSWQWQPTQTTQPTHTMQAAARRKEEDLEHLEDLLVAQQELEAREFNAQCRYEQEELEAREFNAQCRYEQELQNALLVSRQEFQNAQPWSSDFVPRAGGERHRASQSSIHDEMQPYESDDDC